MVPHLLHRRTDGSARTPASRGRVGSGSVEPTPGLNTVDKGAGQRPILILAPPSSWPVDGRRRLQEAGYSTEAADAERASGLASTATCAAIILEVMRIDSLALELCARLSAGPEAPPVLVWALDADMPERVTALDAGAASVITGREAAAELVARIRALLRRNTASELHRGSSHVSHARLTADGYAASAPRE